MRIISLLLLTACTSFSLLPSAYANDTGTLSLFRWNRGYRAENQAVLQQPMTEAEFHAMVESGKLPRNELMYGGCYMAHYDAGFNTRAPASLAKPKSETFRICVE